MTKLPDTLKQILAPARVAMLTSRYSQKPTAFVSGQPELGDLVRMESADGKHHLAEVVVEDIERDDITQGANTMRQFVHEAEGVIAEAPNTIEDFNEDMMSGSDIMQEKIDEYFASEDIRERGYDLGGKRIDYDLRKELGTDGGEITNSYNDRTVYLQGSDWYDLCDQIDAVWKQVRWKKMGQAKAQMIVNDYLSEYFEGR